MILAENGNMITTAVLVAILIAAGIFALRGSLRHFRGKGGCCGDGMDEGPSVPKKKLGTIISKKKLIIDGMHCEGCSAAVADALNRLEHVNADVDLRKKTATVRMDAEVDMNLIIGAVSLAGYKVVRVEEG